MRDNNYFAPNDIVQVFTLVDNIAVDADGQFGCLCRYHVQDSNGNLLSSRSAIAKGRRKSGRISRAFFESFSIDKDLAPGVYYVDVTALDQFAETTTQERLTFHVTEYAVDFGRAFWGFDEQPGVESKGRYVIGDVARFETDIINAKFRGDACRVHVDIEVYDASDNSGLYASDFVVNAVDPPHLHPHAAFRLTITRPGRFKLIMQAMDELAGTSSVREFAFSAELPPAVDQ